MRLTFKLKLVLSSLACIMLLSVVARAKDNKRICVFIQEKTEQEVKKERGKIKAQDTAEPAKTTPAKSTEVEQTTPTGPAAGPVAQAINGSESTDEEAAGDLEATFTPMSPPLQSAPVQKKPQAPPKVKTDVQLQRELAAAKSAMALEEQRKRLERNAISSHLPIGQSPLIYLERLVEHFITHEPGFVAAEDNCDATVKMEMYPLRTGWTVFARYSGNGREERVDLLLPNELSQYAERVVLALLEDVPISSTINRENVLTADSKKSIQRIKGTGHFVVGVGTQLRVGKFNTVVTEGENSGGTKESTRIFHPMKMYMGYRGRFESWGIEALGHVGFGMGKESVRKNSEGGHVDMGADLGLGLHFLRYFDPRGLISFYMGAGSTFELVWFNVIQRVGARDSDSRSRMVTGGLELDGVFGWEFMRAASVQFFLQGEINAPAYMIKTSNDDGSINTWMPGATLKLGMIF